MEHLALEGVLILMVKSICDIAYASVFSYTDFEPDGSYPAALPYWHGFDIFFKLLLDRGYIKLDSIYFDMNKENTERI